MQFLIPLVSMLVLALILNFAVARPQRKRQERRGLMLASLKPGKFVYAGGGIHGVVQDVKSESFTMVTAPSKTKLEFDADALEESEGFDLKMERDHQKYLRDQRTRKREERDGARRGVRPDPNGLRTPKGPHL